MQRSIADNAHHDHTLTVSPWPVVGTLALREWKRFLRQPHRVVGAVGQPLIFWILLGLGFSKSFTLNASGSSVGYGEYFLPDVLAMILLFTAIFATISIIEDRNEGFLQAVLVSPNPPWSMVLGKVLGGVGLALLQAGLFAILSMSWLGIWPGWGASLQLLIFSALAALALTSLGFVMAWQLDSTQGYHALMSVVLFPMWLMSGAAFPGNSPWLKWVIQLNPLTYSVAGIRRLMYQSLPLEERASALPEFLPSLSASWLVTLGFAAVTFILAVFMSNRRTSGDLK